MTKQQPTTYPTLCTSMDYPEYCLFLSLIKGIIHHHLAHPKDTILQYQGHNDFYHVAQQRYPKERYPREFTFFNMLQDAFITPSSRAPHEGICSIVPSDIMKWRDEQSFLKYIRIMLATAIAGRIDVAQMTDELIDDQFPLYPRKREIANVILQAFTEIAKLRAMERDTHNKWLAAREVSNIRAFSTALNKGDTSLAHTIVMQTMQARKEYQSWTNHQE